MGGEGPTTVYIALKEGDYCQEELGLPQKERDWMKEKKKQTCLNIFNIL